MPNWDDIREEWETTKTTLAALAAKHEIKLGTLKSRKSREVWSRDPTKKGATTHEDATINVEKDATIEKSDKPKRVQINRSGNPNPKNQFTKRNSAALIHGLFAKYLPEETMEIMESMNECSPIDLIWDQIQIQYAAIIRAQKIMFVESKDEMIKELKKEKTELEISSVKDGEVQTTPTFVEREYEFQFAWDRHATFLNAQSRAMSELRSLIKQFNEFAQEDDERRLKLEQMQHGVEKTKAEIEKLKGDNDKGGAEDWKDSLMEVAARRKKVKQDEKV